MEPTRAGEQRARVLAVCLAPAATPDGRGGLSGIDKRPVDVVRVTVDGVVGDRVLDGRHHGGRHKAVYAYAAEDALRWSAELGREVAPGWFGENLRLAGVDLVGAVIGERWRVGDAVEVEVSMPRTPCATFQHHVGEPHWVRRFTEAGRVGVYLRVLVPGEVRPGDPVEVLHRPSHGVSAGRWFTEQRPDDARALLDAERTGLELAPDLVAYVERSLRHEAQRAAAPPL
ncbi:MOSC domain-containing protein [Aquipuribacter nitratireducens]|uniref:MOSC domain-containing protein n=1 Tax=Aquipuribacter nitratireducens TaxID=650104 RepID=A0ABW0GL14_9MICO